MTNYIILGGYGNIGQVISKDLVHFSKAQITVAGRNEEKAQKFAESLRSKRVHFAKTEVTDVRALSEILKKYDVCINATQYYYNLYVMKACLKAKTNYIDLGGLFHTTRKQLPLHHQFEKIGKLAILGCGSTPGITNVMASHASQFFDTLESIEISFADADFTQYKQKFIIPYSFYTLVDEFTLNPYIFHKGRLSPEKPLSGEKILWFREFPKAMQEQKGFYTLHSELATFPSSFKEKGLKECSFRVTFPQQFVEKIKLLGELGFTGKEQIKFKGKSLKTLDITAQIMDQWLPQQQIHDEEVVRVDLGGKKRGKEKRMIIDALTKSKGMIPAGTYDTGVPASIIAQMIGENRIEKTGVLPPEQCISPIPFFQELKKRGIQILINNQQLHL